MCGLNADVAHLRTHNTSGLPTGDTDRSRRARELLDAATVEEEGGGGALLMDVFDVPAIHFDTTQVSARDLVLLGHYFSERAPEMVSPEAERTLAALVPWATVEGGRLDNESSLALRAEQIDLSFRPDLESELGSAFGGQCGVFR